MGQRFPGIGVESDERAPSVESVDARKWAIALSRADRACCCAAKPAVVVVMAVSGTDPHPVELLLCGHHYRASRKALEAAGAVVFTADGLLVSADRWPVA